MQHAPECVLNRASCAVDRLCTFGCFLASCRYPAVQRQAGLILDLLQSHAPGADATAWLTGVCKGAPSICLHCHCCMGALYQGPERLHGLKRCVCACQVEDLL